MFVRVEELAKEPYSLLIAYPRPEPGVVKRRIEELRALGITGLELIGRKSIGQLKVLGKGHVGIVLAARREDGSRVALKARRVDADRATLAHEAKMLKLANSVGVGPRLLAHTDDFLVMEFIEGPHIPDWLSARPPRDEVIWVLGRLLEKCRKLDEIGLDHGELSRAHSHVIIQLRPGARPEPRLVDFESASDRRRPANLTSLCQYLFIGGLSGLVASVLGPADREAIIRALRAYKRSMGPEAFRSVLEACGLTGYIAH